MHTTYNGVQSSLFFIWMHRMVLISCNPFKLTEKANWKKFNSLLHSVHTGSRICWIWRECLWWQKIFRNLNNMCMKMHFQLHCLYFKSLFVFFEFALARAFVALFRYHCVSKCQVFMNNNKILWFILQHRRREFFVIQSRFTLHICYECVTRHPHLQWATELISNELCGWT